MLNVLINPSGSKAESARNQILKTASPQRTLHSLQNILSDTTNTVQSSSFNFGDIASQLPTDSATGTFNRRSTENIETQFSPQATHGFTFSAGGTFSTETGDADFVGVPPSPRSKVSSTYGETGATTPNVFFGRASSHSPAKQTSFDPTTWSTKFGRETFTPRHVSPTRSNTTRSTAKKHVSTKSSGSQRSNSVDSNNLETPMRRTSKIHMGTTDSPNAMEIDSPPSSGGGTSQQAPPLPPKIPQAANARNVPVEPAKKEWRSGDIGGGSNVHQESLRRKPVDPAFKSQGSEDSPEFYDSMNDLRNVEPFISQPGLGSMDDLKMNLPFESKSAPAPLKDPSQDHAKPQSLNFPPIPCAPVLPMASYTGAALGIAELQGYVVKFQQYLRDWEIFNKRIVTHFYNRHSELELVRESLGAADLLGDAKLVEQLEWARQDREVRNRWSMACEEHERQIRQYLVVKGQATA
ncbi:uncharacterized protein BROUX77_006612 [Berkeleyomyces rouxiae]|uniref:uncharacterized protein n=1 Tax=Berkeleyomyces rouxiae TaxID=2035830 RepID=UPI003B7F3FEC